MHFTGPHRPRQGLLKHAPGPLGVAIGVGVAVGEGEAVGVALTTWRGVGVADGAGVGVTVGAGVGVAVGLAFAIPDTTMSRDAETPVWQFDSTAPSTT
jgi:hypothetical protein